MNHNKKHDRLITQQDALLEACQLYHDDGRDGALLMIVAELLLSQADYLEGRKDEVPHSPRWLGKLADQLIKKHEAICKALAVIKEL